ncbi:MAG TPA: SDR family NAD(P)-dependent oxidoreductase [Brevundimonas sp.]|jgi:short-subunit dehydrogenase
MGCRILGAIAFILLLGPGLTACATSTGLTSGDPDRIAGRTYVVTGASSGFGRGTAVRLGALGANVVLAARRTELLEEVASEVRAAGGGALVVQTDVADAAAVQRLADQAVGRFGRVDVWINNAGVGAIGRFEDIPIEDHSRLVDINLKGVIYGSHAAMRLFRAQGFGELVNVGSVDSEVPLAYQASYSATKAGVLALGRAMNEEIRLNRTGRIHVSTVMPWAADTPWWPHAANYSGGTPRMAAMDDPQKIVDAIVWVSVHPREELPVGWKAKASNDMHHLFPDITERMSGDIAHRWQIETAPPAPPTHGTLHEPMLEGRAVDGGVRERMAAENEARRVQTPK